MTRILLADDHALMREGLRNILGDVAGFEIVGEATNGQEVLAHPALLEADVVVLDLSMPGTNGIELIRDLCRHSPATGILVLTMHDEELYAVRALRAGARGYLTKQHSPREVIEAIRKISAGGRFISAQVGDQLALDIATPVPSLRHLQLSKRELEIFAMLVHGCTVSGVAAALDVSVKTVSTYKTRIMQKMGMRSAAHLIQYALAHGLLASSERRRRPRPPARAAVELDASHARRTVVYPEGESHA